jgi:hypothetical protein
LHARTETPRRIGLVPWILAHALATGGAVAFMQFAMGVPQGALFAIPVAIGIAQALLLRLPLLAAATWIGLSLAGMMLSFAATWFFIAVIGFTMCAAQSVLVAKRRIARPWLWIVAGGVSWGLGELAGLPIANAVLGAPKTDSWSHIALAHVFVGIVHGAGTGVALRLGPRSQ